MNSNVRVLYKKTGEIPKIKYITDMLPIKKLIVTGDLELVKFEKCLIVCNNRKKNENRIPNIVLDFKHIAGDFFLVGYDEKKKDFRSLELDEAMFYIDSLQHKSFQHKNYRKWQKKQNRKNKPKDQKQDKEFVEYQENQKQYVKKVNAEVEQSPSFNNDMLEMILNIQAVILKYIRNMNGEQ